MSKPRTFHVHFNKFGAKKGSKDIWTVRIGRKNYYARKVRIKVPLETIYKGDSAQQPRAYLKGKGIIKRGRGVITIV